MNKKLLDLTANVQTFLDFLEFKIYITKNNALKTKLEMNVTDLLQTFENTLSKNLIFYI